MSMMFQFAQLWWLLIGMGIVCLSVFIRYFWYKPTLYVYPLLDFIKKKGLQSSSLCSKFLFLNHFLILIFLAILLGKPQFVDSKSKINVEGIDIILALDMSGSMCLMDDLSDQRSRLQVAKQEALHFIDQRKNDAIGLVLFGRYALVRCPLTLDKLILKEIIQDLELGKPSEDMQRATMLAQGLATSVRRLQNSKAKSKIIVLLTDGTPSAGDINPVDVIDLAKKCQVKVYTIGIGGDDGGYVKDAIFGLQKAETPINKQLLQTIAQQTGGKFFEARKPKDLQKIYNIIDSLEKQSYQTELYQKFYDYFLPIVWLIMAMVFLELVMSTFVWFIV